MSKKKKQPADTQTDLRVHLAALNLNVDAPGLADLPPRTESVQSATGSVQLAPEGVNPHTMPVKDIEFDPRLVEEFSSLEPKDRKAPVQKVFELYQSPRGAEGGSDRNKALYAEIGKFMVRVYRSRKTGVPHVKEQVRRTAKQRDLLALMAERGIKSVEDLEALMGAPTTTEEGA